MTPSENRPHRVVKRGETAGPTFPTYGEAFGYWKLTSTWRAPYDIMTVDTGRVIDPGTPVVDVNE